MGSLLEKSGTAGFRCSDKWIHEKACGVHVTFIFGYIRVGVSAPWSSRLGVCNTRYGPASFTLNAKPIYELDESRRRCVSPSYSKTFDLTFASTSCK